MSKPIFIGVAGNIGAGKTTLTEKLSDAIQFQPVSFFYLTGQNLFVVMFFLQLIYQLI